jgi:hypothetical protein
MSQSSYQNIDFQANRCFFLENWEKIAQNSYQNIDFR